jgi:alpha-glucosidase (family GH31 glycosyl hydrolase)
MKLFSLFTGLSLSLLAVNGDKSDLSPVHEWQQPAAGTWKLELGNADAELRYTDLAAEKPRFKAINSIGKSPFPFAKSAISTLKTSDGKIMVRIPCSADEKIYGFGLQMKNIKSSKKVLELKVDHWKLGGGRTHAPVPFYISSKGYGVFFNTARYLKVYNQLGNRKDSLTNPPEVDRNPPPSEKNSQPGPWQALPAADAVEAVVDAEGLEVLIFSGKNMLEVVQRYNLYCGGGTLPPLWGLGFWHRVPAAFNEDECRKEVADFAKYDMPLDVLGLEPGWMTKSYPCTFEWQTERFPDPNKFTKDMLSKGVRLNLWENPYISKKAKIYKDMYPYAGSHLVWLGIVPDYNVKEARELITEQHYRDHVSIGVSGYKIDEVDGYDHWLWPDHATFPSGVSAESMRQTYGMLMQKMFYTDLFKKHNTRTYGLVRSSNGAASALPYVLYSDSYSHSEYITGISAASLGGILWSPEARGAKNGREWLNRIQTVCFSPLAMLNAWATGVKPWTFKDVTEPVRDVINLRMRLLPYLYSAFADYHLKGIPPFRAMILEQGFDEGKGKVIAGKLDSETNPYAIGQIIEKNDQYMFGPSIMVAPFYEEQHSVRSVRLPAGNWYCFYTGKFMGNNKTIKVSAEQLKNRIPLFVKEGSIIPLLDKNISNSREAFGHDLELRIYGKKAATYDLYEDDANTFDYLKGTYSHRKIHCDQNGDITEQGPNKLFGEITKVKVMTK